MIKKAILKSFDSTNYLANVRLFGSFTRLENVPVSRAIPSTEMVVDRTVFILFANPANPQDSMIVGVR